MENEENSDVLDLVKMSLELTGLALSFLDIEIRLGKRGMYYFDISGEKPKLVHICDKTSTKFTTPKGEKIRVINGHNMKEKSCKSQVVIESGEQKHELVITGREKDITKIEMKSYKGNTPTKTISFFDYGDINDPYVSMYYDYRDGDKIRSLNFKYEIYNASPYIVDCTVLEGIGDETTVPKISIKYNQRSGDEGILQYGPGSNEAKISNVRARYFAHEIVSHHRSKELMNFLENDFEKVFPGIIGCSRKNLGFLTVCRNWQHLKDDIIDPIYKGIIDHQCDLDKNGFIKPNEPTP